MDEMAATIGGRVAEQLVNGDISTGALNDLEKLTRQANAMVTYFGMSDKIGNVSYYDSTGRNEMGLTKPYSEKTAEEIDKEVKRLIDQAYATATKVLKQHSKGFEELAQLLLEREVIFSEDVERILGPRPGGVNPNAVIGGEVPKENTEEEPAAEPKEEPKETPRKEPAAPAEKDTPVVETPTLF
jgi:cell division protease FtsH